MFGSGLLRCGNPPDDGFYSQRWKGINYTVRRHGFWEMLGDWNDYDTESGRYVWEMVTTDLYRLSANGFNFLHFYLWSNQTLRDVSGCAQTGQCGALDRYGLAFPDPFSTTQSAAQMDALERFLTVAEQAGLKVLIHLTHTPTTQNRNPAGVSQHLAWAEKIIKQVLPRHRNIVAWSAAYGLEPVPWDGGGAATSDYSITWRDVYLGVRGHVQANSAAPGLQDKMAARIPPGLSPSLGQDQRDGYAEPFTFGWRLVQQKARTMKEMLGYEPDYYLIDPYNANSQSLDQQFLLPLTTITDPNGLMIGPSKIVASEFTTSTSVRAAGDSDVRHGNQYITAADALSPTLTPDGQATWLRKTLCVLNQRGIHKTAFWTYADMYSTWVGQPWNNGGYGLAWSGYWGVVYESEGSSDKPSWGVLTSYYQNPSTFSCNANEVAVAAVVRPDYPGDSRAGFRMNFLYSFYDAPDSTRAAAGAAGKFLTCEDRSSSDTSIREQWPLTDQISQGRPGNVRGPCGAQAVQTPLGASSWTATFSAGSYGNTKTHDVAVNLSTNQVPLYAVTNEFYQSSPLFTNGWLLLWGQSFSYSGNRVRLRKTSGGEERSYSAGSGVSYEYYGQINVNLGFSSATSGTWLVDVQRTDGTWSNPVTISLQ